MLNQDSLDYFLRKLDEKDRYKLVVDEEAAKVVRRIFKMAYNGKSCKTIADTLSKEYFRDLEAGINPEIPQNYFEDDNPENSPVVRWRSHANLLFSNWLNYYVYQTTPYNINEIK